MKVPQDCVHCRHNSRPEVCRLFVNDDATCNIIHSGDEWHIKNHERLGKGKQREVERQFNTKFGLSDSVN
jgi:hypothetical protein